ncbi:MAG: nuclear transport factor 2 family protein [Myxococcales bacterium]|nr:nuclear transport factor 2 family protein [Myxococcales bacterium]
MGTPSDFFSSRYEQVSYPWEYTLLRDWIAQYLAHVRRAPEAAEALKARGDEFEMVPIPRQLVARVADLGAFGLGPMGGTMTPYAGTSHLPQEQGAEVSQPAPFADPLRERAEGLAKLRKYPALVDTVRSFLKALEGGDEKALGELVDDDYLDESGRDKKALLRDISKLVGASSDRRFVPVHAEQLEVAGNSFVATVTGAWEARFGKEKSAVSEFFRLEVVLAPDARGRHRVASVANK